VPDAYYFDHKLLMQDAVDNAIIADADTPQVICAL